MVTGFETVDNKNYYFDIDGDLKTDDFSSEGNRYIVNDRTSEIEDKEDRTT